jgi:hypothetical protein
MNYISCADHPAPNSISDYITGSDMDEESEASGSSYTESSAKMSRKSHEKSHDHPDLQLQKSHNIPNLQQPVFNQTEDKDLFPQPVFGTGLTFSVPGHDYTTSNALKQPRNNSSISSENN